METYMRSLLSMGKMPVPDNPVEVDYGEVYVGTAHDIRLFPAMIRPSQVVASDAALEEGQNTCYFHPKLPAVAICDVSGRMICALCKTEYNGQIVSLESLQSLLKGGDNGEEKVLTKKWDSSALALASWPLLFFPFTLFTAPVALGICMIKWWKGPTGYMRRPRWRYMVAGTLACAQIAFWVYLFSGYFQLLAGIE